MHVISSRFLFALVAAAWCAAAAQAQQPPTLAAAFEQALAGPRAADPNFATTAATIAARLAAEKPQDLEGVVRSANFAAAGIQPPPAGIAWMTALNGVLTAQRGGQVGPSPPNVAEVLAGVLNQARAGEFVAGGPDPIVQQLADALLASEVFRRDVRFTDTAKAFVAELSRMLPLVGTKYQPQAPGQPFADEVIQHLERTVIAHVEGDRMKNEWRATYNAFVGNVKAGKYGPFQGTVADWKLMIERVIAALQSALQVGGTLPANPFATGAPTSNAAAAVGAGGVTTTGGWYSHAYVHHERKMSRIMYHYEIRSLRVQRYRGY